MLKSKIYSAWVEIECNRRRRVPLGDPMQPSGKSKCSRLVLQMELFVDDLVECHGDVRVRAMMVLCCELGFGLMSSSSIYCDTLSVSQYDSKVRSGLSHHASDAPVIEQSFLSTMVT